MKYRWIAFFMVAFFVSRPLMAFYDGKIEHTFSISAPTALQVFLVGEMNNWQEATLPMEKDASGVWKLTLSLEAGRWMYKFVVDGVWQCDENNPNRRADGFGGFNSIVVLGTFEDYGNFNPAVAHGDVFAITIFSTILNDNISFNVYTPPRYPEESSASFPVLFLLHGYGMNERQWFDDGLINNYLDNLIDAKKITPFIVVTPSVGTAGYRGKQERAIVEEIYPHIQKTFRIKKGKESTAIAGISMGGLGAFDLAYAHQDIFGLAIPISGIFYDKYMELYLEEVFHIYFQLKIYVGTEDSEIFAANENLIERLKNDRAPFSYTPSKGAHTWRYWNSITENFLSDAATFFK